MSNVVSRQEGISKQNRQRECPVTDVVRMRKKRNKRKMIAPIENNMPAHMPHQDVKWR